MTQTVDAAELERARAFWAGIARKNGWYREPFGVQVWVDEAGHVLDSVSYVGLERDIVLELEDEDEDEV